MSDLFDSIPENKKEVDELKEIKEQEKLEKLALEIRKRHKDFKLKLEHQFGKAGVTLKFKDNGRKCI